MKATELMVGDWVNYWILNINAKVNDIMSTGRLGIRFIDTKGKEGYIHGVICETVKPIPLTAEILEKNGFNRSSLIDNRWIYEDIVLSKLNDCYTLNYMIGKSSLIYYVHELQHALRLCNIHKEIEL